MDTTVLLFMGGQAIALLGAIIGTYVKQSVRLREIELTLKHTDRSSTHNANELTALKRELANLTIKVEHIQTMQQMLCHNCPLRPHGNNRHMPPTKS